MTEREILAEKVATFTEIECVQKLIEELKEAMEAAVTLSAALCTPLNEEGIAQLRKELIQELADVDTAGRKTFIVMHRTAEWIFVEKQFHSIRVQIPEAIRIKNAEA